MKIIFVITETRKEIKNYFFINMKATFKLFYAPIEQQYYVFYYKDFAVLLYKIENINPLNILRVVEHGTMNPNTAGRIIKEVEEFAISEFKKINNNF